MNSIILFLFFIWKDFRESSMPAEQKDKLEAYKKCSS